VALDPERKEHAQGEVGTPRARCGPPRARSATEAPELSVKCAVLTSSGGCGKREALKSFPVNGTIFTAVGATVRR